MALISIFLGNWFILVVKKNLQGYAR